MSGVLAVRFRPTSKQIVGRAARAGAFTVLIVAIPLSMVADRDRTGFVVSGLVAAFAAGSIIAAFLLLRRGIIVDEFGVHPTGSWPSNWESAHWQRITDIRAEHRDGHTVPVIYLSSGRVWRLRAPYHGQLLAADPHFDEKICTLRNMWTMYRYR